MAYEKTLWKTGDVVTEEKMNKIEQGIKSNILNNIKDGENGGVIEGLVELPEDDPSGTSLNSATGRYAHAEGMMTTSSSDGSHAEGIDTTSSNYGAHSEGYGTIASGLFTHAEGQQSTSSGEYSHAEGNGCVASAVSAHAEGNHTMSQGYASHSEGDGTVAFGFYSHSEGKDTEAGGYYSHASGKGTIARGQGQFVIGEYNVEQGTTGQKVNTDCAFIIGNGVNDNQRSNALGIKWDGTFVFANGTEISPAQFASLLALLDSEE